MLDAAVRARLAPALDRMADILAWTFTAMVLVTVVQRLAVARRVLV